MSLDLPGCKLLIINTYFPQDTQNDNFDEQELLSCLTTIENLIENTIHDQVLVLGDLNCDFSRNSRFVQTVRTFSQSQELVSAWTWFPVDHSYSSPCSTHFSLVDHFLLSEHLGNSVLNAGVIQRGDNVSGHAPIFLELGTVHLPKKLLPEIKKFPRQNWKAATQTDKLNYKHELEEKLSGIQLPQQCLACDDLKCVSVDHCEILDNYIIDIIEAIETTSKEKIPYKNAPKGNQCHRSPPKF